MGSLRRSVSDATTVSFSSRILRSARSNARASASLCGREHHDSLGTPSVDPRPSSSGESIGVRSHGVLSSDRGDPGARPRPATIPAPRRRAPGRTKRRAPRKTPGPPTVASPSGWTSSRAKEARAREGWSSTGDRSTRRPQRRRRGGGLRRGRGGGTSLDAREAGPPTPTEGSARARRGRRARAVSPPDHGFARDRVRDSDDGRGGGVFRDPRGGAVPSHAAPARGRGHRAVHGGGADSRGADAAREDRVAGHETRVDARRARADGGDARGDGGGAARSRAREEARRRSSGGARSGARRSTRPSVGARGARGDGVAERSAGLGVFREEGGGQDAQGRWSARRRDGREAIRAGIDARRRAPRPPRRRRGCARRFGGATRSARAAASAQSAKAEARAARREAEKLRDASAEAANAMRREEQLAARVARKELTSSARGSPQNASGGRRRETVGRGNRRRPRRRRRGTRADPEWRRRRRRPRARATTRRERERERNRRGERAVRDPRPDGSRSQPRARDGRRSRGDCARARPHPPLGAGVAREEEEEWRGAAATKPRTPAAESPGPKASPGSAGCQKVRGNNEFHAKRYDAALPAGTRGYGAPLTAARSRVHANRAAASQALRLTATR